MATIISMHTYSSASSSMERPVINSKNVFGNPDLESLKQNDTSDTLNCKSKNNSVVRKVNKSKITYANSEVRNDIGEIGKQLRKNQYELQNKITNLKKKLKNTSDVRKSIVNNSADDCTISNEELNKSILRFKEIKFKAANEIFQFRNENVSNNSKSPVKCISFDFRGLEEDELLPILKQQIDSLGYNVDSTNLENENDCLNKQEDRKSLLTIRYPNNQRILQINTNIDLEIIKNNVSTSYDSREEKDQVKIIQKRNKRAPMRDLVISYLEKIGLDFRDGNNRFQDDKEGLIFVNLDGMNPYIFKNKCKSLYLSY